MTIRRGRIIGAAKISLIHVAKTQIGMEDAAYRALLRRIAGVDSAKALDDRSFPDVMKEFERIGFTRPKLPVRRPSSTAAGRPTEAQWHSMERLSRQVGFAGGVLDPRFVAWMQVRGKVSHPQFLDATGARAIIAGLSNWARRIKQQRESPETQLPTTASDI